MALSVDQVYVLNCLSYMNPKGVAKFDENETLSSYCERIMASKRANGKDSLLNDMDKGSFQQVDDMEAICERIMSDPELANMRVVATNRVDDGAFSFVAVTADEGEAVVCFQGTTNDKEWADNAKGGSVVSTPEQERALKWYQQVQDQYLNQCGTVTVTGHSKGGNQAKYITLTDKNNSVDRCISFDGQGFSDEFMREYHDEIAARQDKITNYSNENDYVNFLLNDVGERHYVKSDRDIGGFTDYHSIFALSDAYPIESHLTEQNPLINALDHVLNSYLRTLPPWQKDATMNTLAEWLPYFCGDETECTAWMVAKGILVIGDFLKFVVEYIAIYPVLGKWLSWLSETIPALAPVIDSVIWLSNMGFGPGIKPDGDDIQYASTGSSGGANKIRVNTDSLESMARQLRSLSRELADCASQLRSTASGSMTSIARHRIAIGIGSLLIGGLAFAVEGTTDAALRKMAKAADQIAARCSKLASSLEKVAENFEEAENRVVALLD